MKKRLLLYCIALVFICSVKAMDPNGQIVKHSDEPRYLVARGGGRSLSFCSVCLRGFEPAGILEDPVGWRSHKCSDKAPLKVVRIPIKTPALSIAPLSYYTQEYEVRSQCSRCKKLFYFASREAHFHVCPKR